MKALSVIFSWSILFSTAAFAMDIDKENFPNSPNGSRVYQKQDHKPKETHQKPKNKPTPQINLITERIQNGHKAFDGAAIKEAWENFDELQASERQWEDIATKAGAIKWPSQETWKDVVGGHLFFPPETIEWNSEDAESWKLARIDNLWSLMLAANYDHPMGKFYFAKILKQLNIKNTANLRDSLFRQAYKDFLEHQDNPDVCYIIGKQYTRDTYFSQKYIPRDFSLGEKSWQSEAWYKGNAGNFNELDMAWHVKAGNARNKLAVLELRRTAKALFHPPVEEEYRALSKVRLAAKLTDDQERKENLFKEAVEQGDAIAWIDLGDLYVDLNRWDEARACYQKAGEVGILEGYVSLGASYVGDTTSQYIMSQYPLSEVSEDDRKKGIEAFQKAGALGHYKGYEYLAAYYAQLLKQDLTTSEIIKPLMEEALQKGLRLGSLRCDSYVGHSYLDIKKDDNLEELFEYIQSYNQ